MNKLTEEERAYRERQKNAKYFRTIKGKKYPITIDNFGVGVSWQEIEMMLNKRDYKKFCKFMYGQTCPIGGVYKWDLERFLNGRPCID